MIKETKKPKNQGYSAVKTYQYPYHDRFYDFGKFIEFFVICNNISRLVMKLPFKENLHIIISDIGEFCYADDYPNLTWSKELFFKELAKKCEYFQLPNIFIESCLSCIYEKYGMHMLKKPNNKFYKDKIIEFLAEIMLLKNIEMRQEFFCSSASVEHTMTIVEKYEYESIKEEE
jgi:hypothetical protein